MTMGEGGYVTYAIYLLTFTSLIQSKYHDKLCIYEVTFKVVYI